MNKTLALHDFSKNINMNNHKYNCIHFINLNSSQGTPGGTGLPLNIRYKYSYNMLMVMDRLITVRQGGGGTI